jgi:outer membrane protein assembly factor BamA
MKMHKFKSFRPPVLILILLCPLPLMAQEHADSAWANKFGVSFSGYPYVYYTPETELAFGVGGIVTFYTAKDSVLRPSKILLSGYYATTGQYKISLVPQLYFLRNLYFAGLTLDFGYYVDKFFGIGKDTPDIGDTARYSSQSFGAELNFQLPSLFGLAYRSGIIYDFMDNAIVDRKDNPYLNNGEVPGGEGGISSGLGFIWVWDSRDHTFFPNKGGFHQAKAIFYFDEIGSSFDFNKYEADLRQYVAVAPDHVIAVHAYGSFARAFPPFYELPALGGQNRMRGYYQGRFRDKNYVAGQIEYRAYLWWRLGAVAFFGLGDVGAGTRDLKIRDAKKSYGFGLRFKFNQKEKVNLRVDFGFGKDTNGVYFGIEEAF